jgi:hypothetical protein
MITSAVNALTLMCVLMEEHAVPDATWQMAINLDGRWGVNRFSAVDIPRSAAAG